MANAKQLKSYAQQFALFEQRGMIIEAPPSGRCADVEHGPGLNMAVGLATVPFCLTGICHNSVASSRGRAVRSLHRLDRCGGLDGLTLIDEPSLAKGNDAFHVVGHLIVMFQEAVEYFFSVPHGYLELLCPDLGPGGACQSAHCD